MKSPVRTVALALIATTATASGTAATASTCARPAGAGERRIAVPRYVVGGVTTQILADRGKAKRLYVTNGRVVLRTDDEGCRWTTIFVAPEGSTVAQLAGGFAATPGRIALVVTRSPYHSDLTPNDDVVGGNLLMLSSDAGRHWVVRLAGARGVGYEVLLTPADRNVAYVVVSSTLDVTTDGGESWTTRLANTADYSYFGTAGPRAVDPVDAKHLWFLAGQSRGDGLILSSGAMMRSTDGGATATRVADVNPRTIVVQHATGRPAVVTISSNTISHSIYQSTDGGKTFREMEMPPPDLSLQFVRTDRTGTMYAGVQGPSGCNIKDADGHLRQCYNRVVRYDPRIPRWVVEHEWPMITSSGNADGSLRLGAGNLAYYLRAGDVWTLRPDRTGYATGPTLDEIRVFTVAT
ncbi:MAG: hypothetical protein QOE45_2725 [Frankiaceae bacterium]|nr:hypothetical protein [Frankiaceae bacterium]